MVVRTDPTQPESFRASQDWKSEQLEADFIVDKKSGQKKMHSFSAHERNCLFLNRSGKEFADLSLLSGVDNIADGRTFVYWDYDRDGWQDIALVNANSPLLNFYHNSIGQLARNSGNSGHIIAVRYVGANRAAVPSPGAACRDGYGAKVEVKLGQLTLKREHRCGEGFSAQNSATMIIGIGNYIAARSLTVRWPSGKSHTIENVLHGTQLTAYENADESADSSGFDAAPYGNPTGATVQSIADRRTSRRGLTLSLLPASSPPSDSKAARGRAPSSTAA